MMLLKNPSKEYSAAIQIGLGFNYDAAWQIFVRIHQIIFNHSVLKTSIKRVKATSA
jgi:hypothetical protein